MNANKTYLKGKSVFIVSLVVIGVTILSVYLTGIQDDRSIITNSYISLSVIASTLFVFMTYGLHKGIGLKDDFPKFKGFEGVNIFSEPVSIPELPDIDVDDELGSVFMAIILWIGVTIVFVLLLLLLEGILGAFFLVFLGMIYWVFFRALKLVFTKSQKTQGNINFSILYSLSYTILYTGWIYGLVYIAQLLR